MTDTIELKLAVPELPTVLDLATAFYKQVQREAELVEESILGAELDVANAQRIALGKRARAAALREQLTELDKQIEMLRA